MAAKKIRLAIDCDDAAAAAPSVAGEYSTLRGRSSKPRPHTTTLVSVTSPTVTRSGESARAGRPARQRPTASPMKILKARAVMLWARRELWRRSRA